MFIYDFTEENIGEQNDAAEILKPLNVLGGTGGSWPSMEDKDSEDD